MKEITNKNVDMESNKQIRENAKKDVRTKEKVICNVSENCENAPLEKILKNDKTNFNCNFEKHLKFKEKKTCIKLLWGKKILTLCEINLVLEWQLLRKILKSYRLLKLRRLHISRKPILS